jgi:hypothetical protein
MPPAILAIEPNPGLMKDLESSGTEIIDKPLPLHHHTLMFDPDRGIRFEEFCPRQIDQTRGLQPPMGRSLQ